MATLVLGAVGAALGAGFGGTVLGLSGAVIGRAVGATLGRAIDQSLMGTGSQTVEVGRVERFRVMGASEGAAVGQVYGRTRVGGQVIWATRFTESVNRSGGGKGAPRPATVAYSYAVSVAVALCEGEILRVGRIWADGIEIARDRLDLRVYRGTADQLPDPKIEAVEGAGMAPAYRGIAYMVIEALDLGQFGNRLPQFSCEVVRAVPGGLQDAVRAVALMPGTGEYALATTPVHLAYGPGQNVSVNVNTAEGKADFRVALDQLTEELPGCSAASLIVSWFGSDLRCGQCAVKPKVEQTERDGVGMPWRAGGIGRAAAEQIAAPDGRAIYGGTPADASVVQAIAALRAAGQEVMFYPFMLMEQLAGNALADPWTGAADQPVLPWRGRITLSVAPGRVGSPDRTAAAAAEVAAFFGTAAVADFAISGTQVSYGGGPGWGYRRFILHYAHLCKAAGGVDAFCIGSEMRGLTQIRGAGDSFPAVEALRTLAADVRSVLGLGTKISYAADWTEYFGYQTGGDVYFHLDPLWADANIDFVGIDNYMPVADWRDGEDHADAGWGSIYDTGYLQANIVGGEGFDWYYDSDEGRAAQVRLPITDGAYGEPWVYRYKDLKGWWENLHFDRPGGVRAALPTAWLPGSKPIRFTELGCPAVDKGANEPNRFLDPKSSESQLPRFSDGRRDDLMQMQYLRAMTEFWDDPAHNPAATIYAGRMVDTQRMHVWAWDARPFPAFPNAVDVWSDGANYTRGHWISGRAAGQPLAAVVGEICARAGVVADVRRLFGVVRGYAVAEVGSARAALQPLMLAYGFEAVERDGDLQFRMRSGAVTAALDPGRLVLDPEAEGTVETARAPEATMAGRVRLAFIEAEADFEVRQAEAIFPDEAAFGVAQSEFPLVLTRAEGRAIAERWLAEARVARDGARFALPRSSLPLGAGDVVTLEGRRYRIDRMDQGPFQIAEAVRVEPAVYVPGDGVEERVIPKPFAAPVPVYPVFLDLPLLAGDEVAHAPHLAVAARPWPGAVALWSAAQDAGYQVNRVLSAPAVIGVTEGALDRASPGLWDRGAPLRVKVFGGTLQSVSAAEVLNGANVLAIGDGSSDNWEVIQFTDAVLVAPDTYEISRRLRGQAGSDGVAPAVWPAGSTVVLVDDSVGQIDLAYAARGLARHYRVGNAARGYDDPAVVHLVAAFRGIGLRPYAPAHLRAAGVGDVALSWVRRTRLDGDSWESQEVPLGEDREAYLVRVIFADAVVREVPLPAPGWTYTAVMRLADGVAGPYRVGVAQVSDRFGPGPFAEIDLLG